MDSLSDMRLMEKAASAAGYCRSRWSDDGRGLLLTGVQEPWNPLEDDGDALRLAVKLGLRVDAGYCGCADVRGYMVDASEALGHDACAATRRAIVRAAAALASEDD